MKNKLIYPMVLVAGFGVACGGRNSDARNAAQQQYETVQEGSAAGVTSTIQGPGETLPPMTSTNADTTTAFALNPNVAPAGTVPQQAQAIPAYPTGDVPPPMMSSSPTYSTPAAAPVRRPAASAPQQAAQPQQPQQPQAQPVPAQPAPTQTAEPQPAEPVEAAGPADTDTAATAQPEPPKKEEPPPPPADDTSGTQAEEPPPPPPV
jgi:nicotinate-nucleotide--dimethylbenzimidazole phosphoribosyltransferase